MTILGLWVIVTLLNKPIIYTPSLRRRWVYEGDTDMNSGTPKISISISKFKVW